jgi:hypothetical protein
MNISLLINAVFLPDRNAYFEICLKYVIAHVKRVPYHHGMAYTQYCGWSRRALGLEER